MKTLQKINSIEVEISELNNKQKKLCVQLANEEGIYKKGDIVLMTGVYSNVITRSIIIRAYYHLTMGIVYVGHGLKNNGEKRLNLRGVTMSEKKDQRVCKCQYYIISKEESK